MKSIPACYWLAHAANRTIFSIAVPIFIKLRTPAFKNIQNHYNRVSGRRERLRQSCISELYHQSQAATGPLQKP